MMTISCHWLQHVGVQSHVAENGNLCLLANSHTMKHDLLNLDLKLADLLTQRSEFWAQRVRYAFDISSSKAS